MGEDPYVVSISAEMADELGLDLEKIPTEQFAQVFTGQAPIPGASNTTYAMRYGGHQFGTWAGGLLR